MPKSPLSGTLHKVPRVSRDPLHVQLSGLQTTQQVLLYIQTAPVRMDAGGVRPKGTIRIMAHPNTAAAAAGDSVAPHITHAASGGEASMFPASAATPAAAAAINPSNGLPVTNPDTTTVAAAAAVNVHAQAAAPGSSALAASAAGGHPAAIPHNGAPVGATEPALQSPNGATNARAATGTTVQVRVSPKNVMLRSIRSRHVDVYGKWYNPEEYFRVKLQDVNAAVNVELEECGSNGQKLQVPSDGALLLRRLQVHGPAEIMRAVLCQRMTINGRPVPAGYTVQQMYSMAAGFGCSGCRYYGCAKCKCSKASRRQASRPATKRTTAMHMPACHDEEQVADTDATTTRHDEEQVVDAEAMQDSFLQPRLIRAATAAQRHLSTQAHPANACEGPTSATATAGTTGVKVKDCGPCAIPNTAATIFSSAADPAAQHDRLPPSACKHAGALSNPATTGHDGSGPTQQAVMLSGSAQMQDVTHAQAAAHDSTTHGRTQVLQQQQKALQTMLRGAGKATGAMHTDSDIHKMTGLKGSSSTHSQPPKSAQNAGMPMASAAAAGACSLLQAGSGAAAVATTPVYQAQAITDTDMGTPRVDVPQCLPAPAVMAVNPSSDGPRDISMAVAAVAAAAGVPSVSDVAVQAAVPGSSVLAAAGGQLAVAQGFASAGDAAGPGLVAPIAGSDATEATGSTAAVRVTPACVMLRTKQHGNFKHAGSYAKWHNPEQYFSVKLHDVNAAVELVLEDCDASGQPKQVPSDDQATFLMRLGPEGFLDAKLCQYMTINGRTALQGYSIKQVYNLAKGLGCGRCRYHGCQKCNHPRYHSRRASGPASTNAAALPQGGYPVDQAAGIAAVHSSPLRPRVTRAAAAAKQGVPAAAVQVQGKPTGSSQKQKRLRFDLDNPIPTATEPHATAHTLCHESQVNSNRADTSAAVQQLHLQVPHSHKRARTAATVGDGCAQVQIDQHAQTAAGAVTCEPLQLLRQQQRSLQMLLLRAGKIKPAMRAQGDAMQAGISTREVTGPQHSSHFKQAQGQQQV